MDDQVGEARVRQSRLVVEADDVDAAVELARDALRTAEGRALPGCFSDPGGPSTPCKVTVTAGGSR